MNFSRLISLYSVLHKLIVYNWLPSSNTTTLTSDQTILMYKIGHLNQFNLGKTIFDNMVIYSRKISSKGLQPYSSLIYKLIVAKGFQRTNSEIISSYALSLGISHILGSGPRVIDIPYVAPGQQSVAPAEAAEETNVSINVSTNTANIPQL